MSDGSCCLRAHPRRPWQPATPPCACTRVTNAIMSQCHKCQPCLSMNPSLLVSIWLNALSPFDSSPLLRGEASFARSRRDGDGRRRGLLLRCIGITWNVTNVTHVTWLRLQGFMHRPSHRSSPTRRCRTATLGALRVWPLTLRAFPLCVTIVCVPVVGVSCLRVGDSFPTCRRWIVIRTTL